MLAEHHVAGISLLGVSLAGEETVVVAPELDTVFDIGRCPREALTANHCCLSHGHMDHAAGLAYYFSQRNFVGQSTATLHCHPRLAQAVDQLLDVWARIDGQRCPANIVPMEAGQEEVIRRGLHVRAFAVNHHGHALGYALIDRRSKLKPEYMGDDGQPKLTGPELADLKAKGVSITYEIDVPLVCYCGDTALGRFTELELFRRAKVLLVECTFFEAEHVSRAREGKHLHVQDLPKLLEGCENESVLLLHLTRRTPLSYARRQLKKHIGKLPIFPSVGFLMDGVRREEGLRGPDAQAEPHRPEEAAPAAAT